MTNAVQVAQMTYKAKCNVQLTRTTKGHYSINDAVNSDSDTFAKPSSGNESETLDKGKDISKVTITNFYLYVQHNICNCLLMQ